MTAESMRPFDIYSPTKVSDGEGGFTDVLGSARLVYAKAEVFEEAQTILVRSQSNVNVKDIVVLGAEVTGETLAGQYEVLSFVLDPGGFYKRALLQRLEKPLVPLVEEDVS